MAWSKLWAVVACLAMMACFSSSGCGSSGNEGRDGGELCGNERLDDGELCDGDCPSGCDDGQACTVDTLLGSASTCDARCEHAPIEACVHADGCCPAGCAHASDDDCPADQVRIIGVEASSDDGNGPRQALDEDFGTRWSASGDGEWIACELSDQAEVTYVQVAFYRGDERASTFDVEVSLDGQVWTPAATGLVSSGDSLDLETFPFFAGQARHVRFVGHGNDQPGSEEWNSYTEVRVQDFPIDLACQPNDNECGPDGCGGEHPACAQGTCVAGTCCLPNQNECGSDGCGGDHPDCPDGLVCSRGSCQEPSDDFDIVLSQDFGDDPVGAYLRTTWSEDWGLPVDAWSDPCYDGCADEDAWAEARLEIVEEGGNRFLRHELFTKGTGPGSSGTGWWVNIGDHEELYLSYRVRFAGHDWAGPSYHGKLPGFCGSAGCPGGGNPPENYEGFSTRYMFHNTDDLFFYLYYAGMDLSDGPYGDGLYFDPYDNQPGQWHTVTQRVVLNTPGQADGIVEGFLDGVLVAQKIDMDYRNAADHSIATLYFTNFLGGSGEDPVDYGDLPTVDFDDVVIFTYADQVPDIPRGLEPSPPGRVLLLP